ncbi:MAG: transposase [Planctomycetes bacterium]|nr:transposase [Planctomycetota bacterium]
MNDITRAGCWAHARRKLKEALDTGSTSAAHALDLVQQLFAVERPINESASKSELEPELVREQQLAERRAAREQYSAGIVDALYVEVERLWSQRSTLPKSKLGKALGYLESQRQALAVFLEDPRVQIHNNDSERDLRHLAVGRNNWLLFGSQRGGEVACRLFSLMLSCKQCGANPEAYLEDTLTKVATVPASQIATLTPWARHAAQQAD